MEPLLEGAFRDELSQTAVAFKLRLVEPLVSSRVLGEIWKRPFVMNQIRSLIADDTRLEIKNSSNIFVLFAVASGRRGIANASRYKVACGVSRDRIGDERG